MYHPSRQKHAFKVEPVIENYEGGMKLVLFNEVDTGVLASGSSKWGPIVVDPPSIGQQDQETQSLVARAFRRAGAMIEGADSISAILVMPFNLVRLSKRPGCEPWAKTRRVINPQDFGMQMAKLLNLPAAVEVAVLPEMTPLYQPVRLPSGSPHTLPESQRRLLRNLKAGKDYRLDDTDIDYPDIHYQRRVAVAHRQLLMLLNVPKGRNDLMLELQRYVLHQENAYKKAIFSLLRAQIHLAWIEPGCGPPRTENSNLMPYGFAKEINDLVKVGILNNDLTVMAKEASRELGCEISELEFELGVGPLNNASASTNIANAEIDICLFARAGGRRSNYALRWDKPHQLLMAHAHAIAIQLTLAELKVKGVTILNQGATSVERQLINQLQPFISVPDVLSA